MPSVLSTLISEACIAIRKVICLAFSAGASIIAGVIIIQYSDFCSVHSNLFLVNCLVKPIEFCVIIVLILHRADIEC